MICCSVSGCESGVYVKGMCSRHYNRLRTTGTTDDGPKARAGLEDRFWKYVDRRDESQCWPWLGSGVDGYGTLGLGAGRRGRKVLAHRVSWEIFHGKPIPTNDEYHGVVVRHTCHNRSCVNPHHLVLGTQADNVADMWANKSGPKGNARLTQSQIIAIKEDPRSSRKLAPVYGVSDAHIRSIRNGRTWKS